MTMKPIVMKNSVHHLPGDEDEHDEVECGLRPRPHAIDDLKQKENIFKMV